MAVVIAICELQACLAIANMLMDLVIQPRVVYGLPDSVQAFCQTKVACMKLLEQSLSLTC